MNINFKPFAVWLHSVKLLNNESFEISVKLGSFQLISRGVSVVTYVLGRNIYDSGNV